MDARRLRLDGARRILLVKPSALGDVVHALPVAASLARRYPEVRLDWLVEEEAAEVLRGHPALDALLVSGRRRWLAALGHPGRIPGAVREAAAFARRIRTGGYDAVVDLQGLFKSACYVAAAGASLRVGLAEGREGSARILTHRVQSPPQPVHAVERYLAVAAFLDAEPVREFQIAVEPAAEAAAAELVADLPRPLVVLHAAARWETKRWPAGRWRELAWRLAGEGLGIALVGGKGDAKEAGAILAGGPPGARSLAGRLGLKGLAALLRQAALLVCVDSGPMHIAAAVGTPLVALFGATDPRRTGPYGEATILRRELACSPCLSRRCGIVETLRCLREIPAAEVAAAARARLHTGRRTA